MKAETRRKLERLEGILARFEAFEQRTLSDLKRAGFNFVSVEQAFAYRERRRTLDRISREALIERLALIGGKHG